MQTGFQRIVVIGYGKVTGEVLKYTDDREADYGYRLEFIEHEIHNLGVTKQICEERGIPFATMTDKRELAAYLGEIGEKTLIISASNNFLFPASLVERENITIINFHNALLPDYPGRNAPSWVIYQGEERTGITWHYVTAGVDEGNIIVQKSCEIGPDTRAYELTESLMNLACEGFYECFDAVLTECARTGGCTDPPRYREAVLWIWRRSRRNCTAFFAAWIMGKAVFFRRSAWRLAGRGPKFCDTGRFPLKRKRRRRGCCICLSLTGTY